MGYGQALSKGAHPAFCAMLLQVGWGTLRFRLKKAVYALFTIRLEGAV